VKDETDISKLKAGDKHYKAYVGPPDQYDFMGASQFRLLCTLGMRSNHTLLDFGCGSLRAGRLFISYLEKEKYFGIEPNRWLIEDSIKSQTGEDIVKIKKPKFLYDKDFSIKFDIPFDFILAQSIFSHTGRDLVRSTLKNFREHLKEDGMIAVTFVESFHDFGGDGWIYPGVVSYRPSTIRSFARGANLYATRLPWYHPRQTWYVFTRKKAMLPNHAMKQHLKGAVLFNPEFFASWRGGQRVVEQLVKFVAAGLPPSIQNKILRLAKRRE